MKTAGFNSAVFLFKKLEKVAMHLMA